MLSFAYPPLESFLTGELPPADCGCKMEAVRRGKGKKRHTPQQPECYGVNCGAKTRDALDKLHELSKNSSRDSATGM